MLRSLSLIEWPDIDNRGTRMAKPRKTAKATPEPAKTLRMMPLASHQPSGQAARTVTQSNDLIEAAYSLTLNEKRLLLLAAAQLDPNKPPRRNLSIPVTAADFAETFGITSRGHAYEALEDAALRLYDRSIKSIERTSKGTPVEERRWLTGRAVYDNGTVLLEFNEGVLGYMTQLSQHFTSYQLQQVSQLSSFYAIRIYELAAGAAQSGARYLPLETLRSVLDMGEKYPNVKDLRCKVIDPAVEEISATSDLAIEAEPVREGRKVVGFKFTVERQQPPGVPAAAMLAAL